MSMAQKHHDMVTLDDTDREVLEVLADGRANPKLVRDELDVPKGDLNTILVRLGRAGLARQVTRGLYEITDDGRAEIGAESQSADIDGLRRALDDAEAAAERGDGDALRDALGRARDALKSE